MIIELEDTPWAAVHGVLRYIYTFDYYHQWLCKGWVEELAIARLAVKYGIPALNEIAITRFKKLVAEEDGIDNILSILDKLSDPGSDHLAVVENNLQEVSVELEVKHKTELLAEPRFAALKDDKLQMKKCLQGMRGYWYRRCDFCDHCEVVEDQMDGVVCCGKCDSVYERCWFKED